MENQRAQIRLRYENSGSSNSIVFIVCNCVRSRALPLKDSFGSDAGTSVEIEASLLADLNGLPTDINCMQMDTSVATAMHNMLKRAKLQSKLPSALTWCLSCRISGWLVSQSCKLRLISLAGSWWEKDDADPNIHRTGDGVQMRYQVTRRR